MLFKDNQKKTTAMPSNTSEAFNSAETSGQREGSWGTDL